MKKLITIIGTLAYMLIGTTAFAQVPQKFNYQGIARDAKGNPIGKQQMALKISVLPTSDATVPEYEETQMVTTNEFGLYTLQIGNGTPVTGDMKTVKWETGNKYIKVAIDPKGGTDYVDMGTNQLLSVPYAIYADKAGEARVGGSDVKATRALAANNYIEKTIGTTPNQQSLLYDNGTGIQIGGTAPGAQFHVKNTPGLLSEFRIQNDGGTSRMGFFGDGTTTFGNAAYSTTANYAVLNKQKTAFAGNFASGIPNSKLFVFGNAQGSLMMNTADNIGFGTFNQLANTTTTRMFVRGSDGNVGIANTTPNAKLDVNGSGQSAGIRATADVQGGSSNVLLGSSTPTDRQSIAIHGIATTTTSIANGNNIGVAGSANSSITNNIGVIGEAIETPGRYNTGVIGYVKTVSGTGFQNVGVYGDADIAPNSWAGWFKGNANVSGQIRLQTGANAGYVLQSAADGTGSWVDPCTLPCVAAASANDWHLTGNATTTPGANFVGTTDNQDLMFKRNSIQAGLIGTTNTSLGESSLPITTTGNYNTAMGVVALRANTTGDFNEAFGFRSLYDNTTGSYNSAFGTRSLNGNTTGSENVAIGHNTLELNTVGNGNVAVGLRAGYSNAGDNNVAIGKNTLYNNTANENVAVGFESLMANTTGVHNTSIGTKTLHSNITGQENIAVGENAMATNTTGAENVAVGMNALRTSNGSYNTAVGHATLESNTTGIENVAVGLGALNKNTTGKWNTSVGENAMFFNTVGVENTALGKNALTNFQANNNTAIGYNALNTNVTGDRNTALGSRSLINGTGGYNTSVGADALQALGNSGIYNDAVGWKALFQNTTGGYNEAHGVQALNNNTTGDGNVAMGHNALISNLTGDYNTGIGYATNVSSNNLTYASAFGAFSTVAQDNSIILGRSGSGVVQDKVGINTSAPTSALQVVGSFATTIKTISTAVAINATVDDYTFVCSASATIVLPNPVDCNGRIYVIKRTSATVFPSITTQAFASGIGTPANIDFTNGFNVGTNVIFTGSNLIAVTYQSDGLVWHKIADAY